VCMYVCASVRVYVCMCMRLWHNLCVCLCVRGVSVCEDVCEDGFVCANERDDECV